MAKFTVDPDELQRLSEALGGVVSLMGAMPKALDGSAPVGGQALEGAVHHFASSWQFGLSQLEEHMKHVVANLSAAGQAYRQADHNVAAAASCPAGGNG